MVVSAGTNGVSDHGILVPGDVRAARIAEVENAIYLNIRLGAGKITRHEPADVFCQRYTKLTGAHAVASRSPA